MQVLELCLRVYVESADLDATIALYEGLQQTSCERIVPIPETGITAAKVGRFLIPSGDVAHLEAVRYVGLVFYVDDLEAFAAWGAANGIGILHGPRMVTGGGNFTARHPDGLVVEYFEARS